MDVNVFSNVREGAGSCWGSRMLDGGAAPRLASRLRSQWGQPSVIGSGEAAKKSEEGSIPAR